VRAADIFRLGRKIPGAIQGDEPGVFHRTHGFEQTDLVKACVQLVKEAEKMGGFDRIQGLPDMIVAWDALDLEQGAGIVAPSGLFHRSLETQKRWTLRKEDGKSRKRDVGHRVAGVLPLAKIGQLTGDFAEAPDDFWEAAALHRPA